LGPGKAGSFAYVAELAVLPLRVLGGVQLVQGLKRRSSLRLSIATMSLEAVAFLGARQTALAEYAAPAVAHMALGSLCVIGAALHDWPAQLVRKAVAVMLTVGVMSAVFAPSVLDVGDQWKLGYVSAMTLLAFGYWRIVRERWCLAAAMVNAAALATAEAWWLSGVLLHQLGPEAFLTLLAGCRLAGALVMRRFATPVQPAARKPARLAGGRRRGAGHGPRPKRRSAAAHAGRGLSGRPAWSSACPRASAVA
jgi:hypothetical protein